MNSRPLSWFTRTRSVVVAGLCVVLMAATVFTVPRLVDDTASDDAASVSDFVSPSAEGEDRSTVSSPVLTDSDGSALNGSPECLNTIWTLAKAK